MRSLHSRKIFSPSSFIVQNRQLLFWITLIIIGSAIGCGLFTTLAEDIKNRLLSFMDSDTVFRSFRDVSVFTLSSGVKYLFVLTLIFLLGMTPYGGMLILCVVLFYGFCTGIFECCYYETGGFIAVIQHVLPHTLIMSVAVLIACIQSVHMSCMISRQLLPFSAHCGSLWNDFKHYLLHYLLCAVLAMATAACEVAVRLFI